jgi:broad specificity phosphatase PhoE
MQEENNKNYCTLYLVRHGETEWNVKKINQGQSESFLTKKGVGQAKETADKLKDVKFDAIFSSDLSRTKETAAIIKLDRELVIQTSELLRERSYGSFEGKHFDVLKNALKDKLNERENLPESEYCSFRLVPDIETTEEIVNRFLIKIREIAVAYPNKNVLVVSHAGCIKNFLIRIAYIERKAFSGWHFENGGYIKVLSDGVNFFVKEVWGIKKIENESE